MSEEPKEGADGRQPTEEEVSPGEDVYAIFANRFYIVATVGFTRIAFGESATGSKEFYRSAVVLPTDDAKALAHSILRLIGEVEEDEKDAEPSNRPRS